MWTWLPGERCIQVPIDKHRLLQEAMEVVVGGTAHHLAWIGPKEEHRTCSRGSCGALMKLRIRGLIYSVT